MDSRAFWCRIGVVTAGLFAAGCGRQAPVDSQPVSPAAEALAGTITISGSSTVLPLSKLVGEGFQTSHAGVRISVNASSTSDGFNRLCTNQLDISGASRPINASESAACASHQVEFVELPVAFDSLSVVVNPMNGFAECLTVPELKRIWEPAAAGKVRLWSDIRPGFPEEPLALYAPGNTSGTFDYFTLAINGAEGASRGDYAKSDDDTLLANSVAENPNGLAYFGYAYYVANRDKLKLVAVNNGQRCVLPSPGTVRDTSYEPLSRPLFFYVSTKALVRPEVRSFVSYAISPDRSSAMSEAGFVPLPPVSLLVAARRLDRGVTGTIFGGRGSVLGVTADMFADDDEVKNALVR